MMSVTLVTANSDIVAGGNAFTAILGKDGKVYTAGLNKNYQLGRQLNSGTKSSILAPIENLQNITAIATGYTHALALDCKGRVWAWGSGSAGELGNGINSVSAMYDYDKFGWSIANQYQPVQVCAGVANLADPMAPLENIVAISDGAGCSFAVTSSGKLLAWGDNNKNSLGTNGKGWSFYGDNTPISSTSLVKESSLPVYVINSETGKPLENVIAVTSKYYHAYALVDDDNDGDPTTGRVYAWGEGFNASEPVIAGVVSPISASAAVLVVTPDLQPLKGISKIVAGDAFGYFLHKVSGTVYSVGADELGQRGLGVAFNADKQPFATPIVSGDVNSNTPIKLLSNVADIAAGQVHALASVKIRETNYLVSWGGRSNYWVDGIGSSTVGHLGQNGLATNYLAYPKFVKYQNGDTVKNVMSVSAGSGGSYVTILDPKTLGQKLLYFGDNSVGQAAMGNMFGDDVTPTYPYPTILNTLQDIAQAHPVADLGNRIQIICPNEIPNTGKTLFAGSVGSDYSYTWDLNVANRTVTSDEIKNYFASSSTDAYFKIFAAGQYKVSILQAPNVYFDATYCPANRPVTDSILVQFCDPGFILLSDTISTNFVHVAFSGSNNETYGLFTEIEGGDTLSIDTVSGGLGYFDFQTSKLKKVTADLNGTAYPDSVHYVRAYSENISVHNLELMSTSAIPASMTGVDKVGREFHKIVVSEDSVLFHSLKVNVADLYQPVSFVVVFYAEKIDINGYAAPDVSKILFTSAPIVATKSGEYEMPVETILKGSIHDYWIGVKSEQSTINFRMTPKPTFPIFDPDYDGVKITGYGDPFGSTSFNNSLSYKGICYDFKFSTYGSNPCGRIPIDFKLDRHATAAQPLFQFGTGKEICVKDTVSLKPYALATEGGALLCHNVYYFQGYIDMDSLKSAGISNVYQEFLSIRSIDSLPWMRAPYDSADKFTVVVADAIHPDSVHAWTSQYIYFNRHPRTSISVSPESSFELCPGNSDSVTLSFKGVAPFAVSYDYSGNVNTISVSDTLLKFPVGKDPGSYKFKLLSMSDANCSAFTEEDIITKTPIGGSILLRDTIRRAYTVREYPAMNILPLSEFVAGSKDPVKLAEIYAPVSALGTSVYTLVGGDILVDGLWDISDREMPAGDYCIAFEYTEAGECPYRDTFCVKIAPAPRYDLTIVVTDGTDPLVNITLTIDGAEYSTDAAGKVVIANVLPDTFDYSIAQDGYQPVSGTFTLGDADLEKSIPLAKIIYQAELAITDGAKPIAGATVSFEGAQYVSDADGLVSLSSIAYGSYPVTVEAQGYKTITAVLNAKGTDAVLVLPIKMREQRVEVFNPIALSACTSIEFAGKTLTESGEYRDTIVTASNKDSIIILTATIWPVYNITKDVELPFGKTYLLGDKVLSESGLYDSTLVSVNGCDSIVSVNLTILPRVEYVIDSVATACGAFTFAGTVYTQSGIYRDSLKTKLETDSVIVLTLIIYPVYNVKAEKTVAYGESFLFGSQTLTQSGTFTEVFHTGAGCDSTVELSFTVEKPEAVVKLMTVTACGSYTFAGKEYSSAGDYKIYDTIVGGAANGADSVVILALTINTVYTKTLEKSIVYGESLVFGTQTLTTSGEYTEVFPAKNGCDSTMTIILTVEKPAPVLKQIADTACGSYLFAGILRDTSGIYRDTLVGEFADTITVLNLTVGQAYYEEIQVTLWVGQTYMFGDEEITATKVGQSTYTKTFTSRYGCDSIVTMNLTTVDDSPGITVTINKTVCGSYTFGSLELTESGTYTNQYVTPTGQDSVVTLTLTVNPVYATTQSVNVNHGESYKFGSQLLTESGTYTEIFNSIGGCDSTVVLNFTVEPDTTVNAGDTLSVEIDENPAVGDVIISLPDTAANGDTLIYSLSDTTSFEIINNQIVVKDSTVFDADDTDELIVVVYIKHGDEVDSALVKIPVINVNEKPELDLGALSVTENSKSESVITVLSVVDQDGDTLVYSLVDSSVVILIDGALVIADSAAFDAENGSVTVQLIVSDGVFTDTLPVSITVINKNDNAPVFETTTATFSIAENLANGTVIGTVSATDADADILTFSISGANGAFAINPIRGEITVADSSLLDYEKTASITFTVTATDGVFSQEINITVNLTDIVETSAAVSAIYPVAVYPTETSSTVTVDVPAVPVMVTVIAESGIVVYTVQIFGISEIDLSQLALGMYHLQISGEGFLSTAEVLVK